MKGIILSTILLVSALGCSEQTCPSSWTHLDRSCYVIVDEWGTWIDARDYCNAFGGYLAEINNADENRLLTTFMKRHGAEGAWIGLNDIVEDGQFRWITTQTAPSYTNFAPGQPDNDKNKQKQDCVWLTNKPVSWTPGMWDDNDCSVRLRFICERSTK